MNSIKNFLTSLFKSPKQTKNKRHKKSKYHKKSKSNKYTRRHRMRGG